MVITPKYSNSLKQEKIVLLLLDVNCFIFDSSNNDFLSSDTLKLSLIIDNKPLVFKDMFLFLDMFNIFFATLYSQLIKKLKRMEVATIL